MTRDRLNLAITLVTVAFIKARVVLIALFMRLNSLHDKDTKMLYKTRTFTLPLQKRHDKSYKIPQNSLIWTCFSSDFLIKEADLWRDEVWKMMKIRKDCTFVFSLSVLNDWGSGNRSERIRTYNYPQNRLTDHRISLTLYILEEIILGGLLDEFINPLIAHATLSLLLVDIAYIACCGLLHKSGTQYALPYVVFKNFP